MANKRNCGCSSESYIVLNRWANVRLTVKRLRSILGEHQRLIAVVAFDAGDPRVDDHGAPPEDFWIEARRSSRMVLRMAFTSGSDHLGVLVLGVK